MPSMLSYPRRLPSGHFTCYLNRTYHVLTTGYRACLTAPTKVCDCVRASPFPGMPTTKFRRVDMRRKSMWFVLSAGIMVTALFHARPAMATPPNGFTSTTIAKGQFGEINVFNQFIPPKNNGNLWLSLQKTKGLSDGSVLNNVWQPGGSTGWHTHLGHTLIFVTAGTVTQYQGDDPTCAG